MNSTTSGMGNTTTPRPSADAWCVYEMDSSNSPTILDSCGVSSVTRVVQGIYRVAFTNPERFQSGAYVGLVQQEVGNAPGGYGNTYVQGNTTDGSVLALGQSGSCDIVSLGFAPGTTTSSPFYLVDSANSNKARFNAAFFCLRSDSDTRKSSVANLLTGSENFIGWTPGNNFATKCSVALAASVKTPFGSSTPSVVTYDGTGGQPFIGPTNGGLLAGKTYTYSLYARAGTASAFSMWVGAGGNNHGPQFNLTTNTISNSAIPGVIGAGSTYSSRIEILNDGWRRCIMTFRSEPSATNPASYTGNPYPIIISDGTAGTVYLWAAQVEEGSIATPYIPTTTTSPVYGDQTQLLNHSPGAGGSGVGSRQNLLTYSQDFTNAAWQTYGGLYRLGVSAGGFTAPDGTTTAM